MAVAVPGQHVQPAVQPVGQDVPKRIRLGPEKSKVAYFGPNSLESHSKRLCLREAALGVCNSKQFETIIFSRLKTGLFRRVLHSLPKPLSCFRLQSDRLGFKKL